MDEPFDLLDLLYTGSYFQVFKARVLDEELRQRWKRDVVALKIPLTKKHERLLRANIEAWMRQRDAESPHLLSPLDYTVFRDMMVLVMPLASGRSLRRRIGIHPRSTPLTVDEARPIALNVLDALAAIHRAGLVYRHVRPENILLDGDVAMLDAIEWMEEDDPDANPAGTLIYLAPERIQGAQPSPASDVWAFGITLYETITGTWPFPAHPMPETLSAILAGVFLAPSAVRPGIDSRIDDLIAHALTKNPAERATVEGLRRALM